MKHNAVASRSKLERLETCDDATENFPWQKSPLDSLPLSHSQQELSFTSFTLQVPSTSTLSERCCIFEHCLIDNAYLSR